MTGFSMSNLNSTCAEIFNTIREIKKSLARQDIQQGLVPWFDEFTGETTEEGLKNGISLDTVVPHGDTHKSPDHDVADVFVDFAAQHGSVDACPSDPICLESSEVEPGAACNVMSSEVEETSDSILRSFGIRFDLKSDAVVTTIARALPGLQPLVSIHFSNHCSFFLNRNMSVVGKKGENCSNIQICASKCFLSSCLPPACENVKKSLPVYLTTTWNLFTSEFGFFCCKKVKFNYMESGKPPPLPPDITKYFITYKGISTDCEKFESASAEIELALIDVTEMTTENILESKVDEAAESGDDDDDYDLDVHLLFDLNIDDVVDFTQPEEEIRSETSLGDLISSFSFCTLPVCENASVNFPPFCAAHRALSDDWYHIQLFHKAFVCPNPPWEPLDDRTCLELKRMSLPRSENDEVENINQEYLRMLFCKSHGNSSSLEVGKNNYFLKVCFHISGNGTMHIDDKYGASQDNDIAALKNYIGAEFLGKNGIGTPNKLVEGVISRKIRRTASQLMHLYVGQNLRSAYMCQEDLFFSQLTISGTASSLTAELHLPEPSSVVPESDEYAIDLLFMLGHTTIGDSKFRGASADEKIHHSLACVLVGSPSMIFTDGWTTGHDVFQAKNVIETLRGRAHDGHTMIYLSLCCLTAGDIAIEPFFMTIFIVFRGYYIDAEINPFIFYWFSYKSLIRVTFEELCTQEMCVVARSEIHNVIHLDNQRPFLILRRTNELYLGYICVGQRKKLEIYWHVHCVVITNELKSNLFAKWLAQVQLACTNVVKMRFVSRIYTSNSFHLNFLVLAGFKQEAFATQVTIWDIAVGSPTMNLLNHWSFWVSSPRPPESNEGKSSLSLLERTFAGSFITTDGYNQEVETYFILYGGMDASGKKIAASTHNGGWELQGIDVSKTIGEMIVVFRVVDENFLNNCCSNLWLKNYGMRRCLSTFVLIFDLGGRTFDMHILMIKWSMFEVTTAPELEIYFGVILNVAHSKSRNSTARVHFNIPIILSIVVDGDTTKSTLHYLSLWFSLPRPLEITSFWLQLSYWFSSPRSPEVADLEDKVNFMGRGMLRNGIIRNIGGYICILGNFLAI